MELPHMKIGVLTPSIYMYEKRYKDRIFAPGDLARALVAGLTAQGNEVSWFTAPEDARGSTLVPGNEELLTGDLQFRVFQDMPQALRDTVSLYGTKMYYELDLVARAYATAQREHIQVMHNFHSFGYFAHFFQELTGIPTVYTFHDPVPTDLMLERWLLDRFPTHKFISISNSQRGKYAEHFMGTVYNGIDPERFPFDAAGGNRLVSVGRMIPEKGHDIAISAAKAQGTGLTIASWVSDSVKNSVYYKEKIAPFIDGKSIVLNSLMQGTGLAEVYQKSKALLFPLQWEEPFGLVMVEAMSAGTPVIAYNRGSAAEVVADGVTGFIIDPDDTDRPGKGTWKIKKQGVEGLAEAIQRVGELDRAACRKRVEEHFTIRTMVAGYEAMYSKAT